MDHTFRVSAPPRYGSIPTLSTGRTPTPAVIGSGATSIGRPPPGILDLYDRASCTIVPRLGPRAMAAAEPSGARRQTLPARAATTTPNNAVSATRTISGTTRLPDAQVRSHRDRPGTRAPDQARGSTPRPACSHPAGRSPSMKPRPPTGAPTTARIRTRSYQPTTGLPESPPTSAYSATDDHDGTPRPTVCRSPSAAAPMAAPDSRDAGT